MNPTIQKFGYPASLVREFAHWVVLVRRAQATLGSLVLAAKSDVTAFADLPAAAFAELRDAVGAIERGLTAFRAYDKINYLMLMMVDREVHFHIIPRYSEPQQWGGLEFSDSGWRGAPQLADALVLDPAQIAALAKAIARGFD